MRQPPSHDTLGKGEKATGDASEKPTSAREKDVVTVDDLLDTGNMHLQSGKRIIIHDSEEDDSSGGEEDDDSDDVDGDDGNQDAVSEKPAPHSEQDSGKTEDGARKPPSGRQAACAVLRSCKRMGTQAKARGKILQDQKVRRLKNKAKEQELKNKYKDVESGSEYDYSSTDEVVVVESPSKRVTRSQNNAKKQSVQFGEVSFSKSPTSKSPTSKSPTKKRSKPARSPLPTKPRRLPTSAAFPSHYEKSLKDRVILSRNGKEGKFYSLIIDFCNHNQFISSYIFSSITFLSIPF